MRRILFPLGLLFGIVALLVFIYLGEQVAIDQEDAFPKRNQREEVEPMLQIAPVALPRIVRESTSYFGGLEIRVVDAVSGKRLPGAKLRVIDFGGFALGIESLFPPDSIGEEVMLEALSKTYFADSFGVVHLPPVKGKVLAVGQTENRFASQFWNPPHENPRVLELQPMDSIVVRVINSSGEPIEGVFAALFLDIDSGFYDMTTSRSGQDGLAALRILPSMIAASDKGNALVTPLLLVEESKEIEVNLQHPSSEPVDLVIPQTGSAEISIVDENGKPVNERCLVYLSWMVPSENGGDWIRTNHALFAKSENGVAVIPHVGLNQRFHVTIVTQDFLRRAEEEGWGPKRNGERVSFLVEIEEEKKYFLVGRILNTSGEPAKSMTLEVRIRRQSGGREVWAWGEIQTDDDGFFRHELAGEGRGVETRGFKVLVPSTGQKGERVGEIEIPYAPNAGSNDLGNIVVDLFPVLVSGTILDSHGNQVAGAQLTVKHRLSPDSPWAALGDPQPGSQKDGSFEIRGEQSLGELLVTATHDEHSSRQSFAFVGDSGIKIRLGKTINVKGRFLFDPLIGTVGGFTVRVTNEALESSSVNSEYSVRSNGQFYLLKQEPGFVTLALIYGPSNVELGRWEHIEFASDDAAMILPDLNMRNKIFSLSVEIKDESGEMLPSGWVRDLNGGTRQDGSFMGKRHHLVGLAHSFDVEVGAKYKRTQLLSGVMGEQVVVLNEGLPVEVVISNIEILGSQWRLYAQPVQLSGEKQSAGNVHKPIPIAKSGITQYLSTWQGESMMRFKISRRVMTGIPDYPELEGSGAEPIFFVEGWGQLQTIQLRLEPSALERAKQKVRDWEESKAKN